MVHSTILHCWNPYLRIRRGSNDNERITPGGERYRGQKQGFGCRRHSDRAGFRQRIDHETWSTSALNRGILDPTGAQILLANFERPFTPRTSLGSVRNFGNARFGRFATFDLLKPKFVFRICFLIRFFIMFDRFSRS